MRSGYVPVGADTCRPGIRRTLDDVLGEVLGDAQHVTEIA